MATPSKLDIIRAAGQVQRELAAAGQQGVTHILDIIRNELDLTMAFCGHTDVSKLDAAVLEGKLI